MSNLNENTIGDHLTTDIPLADEDGQSAILSDRDGEESERSLSGSVESLTGGQLAGGILPSRYTGDRSGVLLESDLSPDEAEEKAKLIAQVLELQNTLDDLSHRVDSVKEENLKLKSENQVLGQYIENLMSASNVFHSTSANRPNGKSKGGASKTKK